MCTRRGAIVVLVAGAVLGSAAVAAAQGGAATGSVTTLWNFLGIPQAFHKARDVTTNRRGNTPRLERKPPLKRIADPANLESENPAIKTAAEIKTEEDLAKQKIKAIKYLAKVGCGCYPGVKEALMAALDDCTEKVRLEAARAIRRAANRHCETCDQRCCCDEELSAKLAQIAFERDDEGCCLEKSARVREAALAALQACCPGQQPPYSPESMPPEVIPPSELPGDRPPSELPGNPPATELPGDPPPSPPDSSVRRGLHGSPGLQRHNQAAMPTVHRKNGHAVTITRPERDDATNSNNVVSIRFAPPSPPGGQRIDLTNAKDTAGRKTIARLPVVENTPAAIENTRAPEPTLKTLHGEVVELDRRDNTMHIYLKSGQMAREGSRVKVFHRYLVGESLVGELKVVESGRGYAIAKPFAGATVLSTVARGDRVVVQQ